MNQAEIEVTVGSRLRSVHMEIVAAVSLLRPGTTVMPQIVELLNRAAAEASGLAGELEAYFHQLLEERHDRRMASAKAALRKSLKPAKKK